MVLPGIQALFGFQLVAVFNNRFQELTTPEQRLHLTALLLVALAVGLIMTPAAYHRIAERGTVSRRFVEVASRFLAFAMAPLMLSIAIDLYLLARLILHNVTLSAALALAMLLVLLGLWFVFPWTQSALERRRRSGRQPRAPKA
jgi:Family of unknown function (DUF6328)